MNNKMINIIIVVAGSNDLQSPLMEGINSLVNNINLIENMNLTIIYDFKEIKKLNLWGRGEVKKRKFNSGVIEYKDGILSEVKNTYFKKVKVVKNSIEILDVEKILENFINNNSINIVILEGHGGLFQCFLDMSTTPAVSLNTEKLCKIIKKYPIALLFLDMCGMNYIEIFYELFHNSKLQNLVTYKNQGPFEYIDYMELFNELINNEMLGGAIEKFLYKEKYPLVYFNKENFLILEEIKLIENFIGNQCLNKVEPNFNESIIALKKLIESSVTENESAKKIRVMPLNFIKNQLEDSIERKILNNFEIAKDNTFLKLFCGTEEDNNFQNEVIPLDRESIEYIIWLHNPKLMKKEVVKMASDFIKERGEEKFYQTFLQ